MSESPVPDLSAVASPPPRSLSYEDLKLSEEPIGGGGQAVVYKATVIGNDTPSRVALKEPLHSGTSTFEVIESFLKEAKTWQTIDRREREKPRWSDYEHIVGVIDTGQAGVPWIAMEYMDGGDLSDRLDNNSEGLPVDQALWIGECLCRGLEIADEYGYSHLDVKPKNILFRQTPEGTWDVPKLADWGVARTLADETGTMEAKTIMYSAPEQFEPSEFGDPDSLTDLYQVGAVVYEMLTGEPPYTGSNTQIMRDVVLGDGADPPSHHRSGLAEAIDVAVTKAMAKQKSDRYRGLQNFEHALRGIRTGKLLPPPVANQLESSPNRHQSENKKEEKFSVSEEPDQERKPAANIARTEPWPEFQGDTTRTGYRPQISAPDPPVTKKLHFKTGNAIESSPAVADDSIFVGSKDGCLYAVDASTGEEIWQFETGGLLKSSPALANDTAFVGSKDGCLYAVDASSGKEAWHFETKGLINSSPAVTNGTVFVGSWDNSLYAIDANTGEERWHFETEDMVDSSPAVANGTVFVGSDDCKLYAVDASTGEELWCFKIQSKIASSPAVANNTVFVGSNYGSLYAVNASTGEEIWHFEIDGSGYSSPAVAGDTVFVGSRDGSLYAVNSATGGEVWHFDTEGEINSSPAVADGTVFVGSKDGCLYAVDTSTGEEVWQFKTGRSIKSSPAVADETVYVGSDDCKLYASSEKDSTKETANGSSSKIDVVW